MDTKTTNQNETRVTARIKQPMTDMVNKLRDKGITDVEMVRRGIRLVAEQEKIAA